MCRRTISTSNTLAITHTHTYTNTPAHMHAPSPSTIPMEEWTNSFLARNSQLSSFAALPYYDIFNSPYSNSSNQTVTTWAHLTRKICISRIDRSGGIQVLVAPTFTQHRAICHHTIRQHPNHSLRFYW